MDNIIGTRQRVWHTILHPTIFIATLIPLIIFKDWITDTALGFVSDTAAEGIFWTILSAWSIFSIIKNIGFVFDFIDMVHILAMPRNLVILNHKNNSVSLEKAVKITDEEVQSEILDKLDCKTNDILNTTSQPKWLCATEVDADDIWEENWFGKIEIDLSNIKAVGLLTCTKKIKKLDEQLKNNKDIRGAAIIVSFDNEIFVQPKLQNLRTIYIGLSNQTIP
ncbi:MAG: hypothetical protein FWE13_01905 [Firmicutes bacterium]|nr:hypothetical protein [Bacillota bacterium]